MKIPSPISYFLGYVWNQKMHSVDAMKNKNKIYLECVRIQIQQTNWSLETPVPAKRRSRTESHTSLYWWTCIRCVFCTYAISIGHQRHPIHTSAYVGLFSLLHEFALVCGVCSQPYIRSHSFANRARKISRIRKRDETTTIPAADCSTLDSRTHQRRTTIFICTKSSRRLQFEFVARPKNNTFFITSNICPRSLAGLKYIFFPLLTTISSSNAVSCHRFYYNNFVSRVFVMVL